MSTLQGASTGSSPVPLGYTGTGSPLPARRPRINLRLVVVLALVSMPFLYFGYVIVDQALHKGVVNRGNYYDVDLKSLGYFPFDASRDDINDVPQRWRDLDGKRVALVGEMYTGGSSAEKV